MLLVLEMLSEFLKSSQASADDVASDLFTIVEKFDETVVQVFLFELPAMVLVPKEVLLRVLSVHLHSTEPYTEGARSCFAALFHVTPRLLLRGIVIMSPGPEFAVQNAGYLVFCCEVLKTDVEDHRPLLLSQLFQPLSPWAPLVASLGGDLCLLRLHLRGEPLLKRPSAWMCLVRHFLALEQPIEPWGPASNPVLVNGKLLRPDVLVKGQFLQNHWLPNSPLRLRKSCMAANLVRKRS
mmetsp:Transcript_1940/g.5812  ORF Transcript_1940/g.5812 Transcript_1940/m.5812 type:complete len:238 (+) Transcript_1940:756-1469(+)